MHVVFFGGMPGFNSLLLLYPQSAADTIGSTTLFDCACEADKEDEGLN
jgi:hypothetical protein